VASPNCNELRRESAHLVAKTTFMEAYTLPSYWKSTPEILHLRLQELREELEVTPALLAEIRLVEGLLAAIDAGPTTTHGAVSKPWDAIETGMNRSGDFKLTRKGIIQRSWREAMRRPSPKPPAAC
jgi:hypothetical protein